MNRLLAALLMIVVVYVAFLIGHVVVYGAGKAVGIGIFYRVLYSTMFWVVAIAVGAASYWMKR